MDAKKLIADSMASIGRTLTFDAPFGSPVFERLQVLLRMMARVRT